MLRSQGNKGGKSPSSVGEILPGVLKGLGLEERLEEKRLRQEWAKIVGESVSQRCRPGAIRKGTLVVAVANNVWMQELQFHRKRIVAKIGEIFPGLQIKNIRLKLEREPEKE